MQLVSAQNKDRFAKDPIKPPGENSDSDTFRHIRAAIKKDEPSFFVLENTNGTLLPRSSDDPSTPLEYFLDDELHGLRTICGKGAEKLYDVAVRTTCKGTSGSLPLARPRTLFWGGFIAD